MSNIKRRFSLPNEQQAFKNIMKRIEGCDMSSSKTSENSRGPEVEEIYKCPCGNIKLIQESIITDVDHPERGNTEIVHMESKGCVL